MSRDSHPAFDPMQSVAVAASAGSGKTWLLVARIVRLLLADATPGGILALTFTRKAAAEMRERVTQKLRQLAYGDDETLDKALREIGLEPTQDLGTRARLLYERLAYQPLSLRAMTLHGFCQEVLMRFALEAQVPAGFTLLEDESEIHAAAFDGLWNRIRSDESGPLAEALRALFDVDVREAEAMSMLSRFLAHRSDWWAFTEHDDDPVAAASTRLATQLDLDPGSDPFAAIDAPAFAARMKMLAGAVREAGGVGTLKADNLFAALDLHGAERADLLAGALLTGAGEPRAMKKKKAITDPQWAHISESFNLACVAVMEVREQQLRHMTWQRNSAAFRLGQALLDEFQSALDRRGALGFAELEWRTCQLLSETGGSTWVRYKLDQRLEHVLLDEFQDTNPTQWRLLRPLVEEFEQHEPGSPRSLFMVGDSKQSIYGFRRAAPELMREAQKLICEQLHGSQQPLNASWRSAPAVIDFINLVFSGDAGTTIEFTRHETRRCDDWGAVEVLPLVSIAETVETTTPAGLRDPLATPFHEAAARASEEEGELIATRISTLVAAGLPVVGDHGARPLRWGDVMILARQRTHLWAIEAALAGARIPFVGSTRGALLDTVLAQDLMALLRVLDAPHRDLDLAQVLRSPLFAASDADLIRLASAAHAEPDTGWWSALIRISAKSEPGTALARARELLPRWCDAARQLPAHDLLDRIAREGDVANRFSAALPHEPRVRANLGAFIQRVLDTDAGRYPTLGRLNSELDRLSQRDGDAPDEANADAGENRVRILTIHAAKGLEAPAVFLVNAAPASRAGSGSWNVQWPAEASAPSHFLYVGRKEQRDAFSQSILDRVQQQEARESLNLLYVGLTRARQYLFVSAFESAKAGWDWERSWHARCWNALDMESRSGLPLSHENTRGLRTGEFPAASTDVPPHESTQSEILAIDPRLNRPVAEQSRRRNKTSETVVDTDATRRGIAIHRLLQRIAEGESEATRLRDDLARQLDLAADDAEFTDWLREAQTVVTAPELRRFFTLDARTWNEVPVLVVGQPLGVIDRLVDDGETLWILDYKTMLRPEAAVLIARYRNQMENYVIAVTKLWPHRPIRAALIATATSALVEIPAR